jgi:hypothetical protein
MLSVSGQFNGGEANMPFDGASLREFLLIDDVDCDGKVDVQDFVFVASTCGVEY